MRRLQTVSTLSNVESPRPFDHTIAQVVNQNAAALMELQQAYAELVEKKDSGRYSAEARAARFSRALDDIQSLLEGDRSHTGRERDILDIIRRVRSA